MSAQKISVLSCDGRIADEAGENVVACDQRFTAGVERIDHTRAVAKRQGWTHVVGEGTHRQRPQPSRDYCEACTARRQLSSRGHRILDDAIAFLKGEKT